MLNFTQNNLKTMAEKILEMRPDPIPRFRLVRDVLRLDPGDAVYRDAESAAKESKWVALLRDAQLADGTWGRFHTQDSRLKQPFPTTEVAIAIALDSGLDKHTLLLQKTIGTIVEYVDGETVWPDTPEKHENPLAWYVWGRHFSAAVLALIDRQHPRLDEFWNLWAEAMRAAFHSGSYDRQKEIEVLNLLLECRMKNPVPFHKKYPLLILSATNNRLPEALERQLLDFVVNSPEGIYYVYAKTIHAPVPPILSKDFWHWFQAHKLLSRFPLWRTMSEDAVNGIWAQRTGDGLWDLGGKIARKPFTSFPLSEAWRRPENRLIDSSVEILTLLSKCFDER
ncbi:MAG: hypothetical protein JXA21_12750 [Anaerolineae bacterium]|nr:hypothetical protein [Anaerolineae bacterium]